MSDAKAPRDKAEMLAWVEEARAALDAAFSRVPAARQTAPLLDGGRSVKDLMAHVAAWDEFLVLAVREFGLLEPVPPLDLDVADDTDTLNARIFAKFAPWSLADVQAYAARVYPDVLAVLRALPEDRLAMPTPFGQMLRVIAGNTYDHYREHAAEVAARLDEGQADKGPGLQN